MLTLLISAGLLGLVDWVLNDKITKLFYHIIYLLSLADGNLRLRGGNHVNEGRLEIFRMGEWGTICDDSWSIQDAMVACRQLGFPGALKEMRGAYYGVGDGAIWLDEVGCTGDEPSLLDCAKVETHDCSHEHDAGVVCTSK